jgi:hypothetical protein
MESLQRVKLEGFDAVVAELELLAGVSYTENALPLARHHPVCMPQAQPTALVQLTNDPISACYCIGYGKLRSRMDG